MYFKNKILKLPRSQRNESINKFSFPQDFFTIIHFSSYTQVRIAEADNTAQYWPNIVDSLNLPTFNRNLAQYRPYTKPIVTFTLVSSSESRKARVPPIDGTLLGHVSILLRQTILELRKPKFGTALARCCAENKCGWADFGPELAAKCIPELSFQQRHNIDKRSSSTFLLMLDQCWAVCNFEFGQLLEIIKDILADSYKLQLVLNNKK